MSALYLGATQIKKAYLGPTPLKKALRGAVPTFSGKTEATVVYTMDDASAHTNTHPEGVTPGIITSTGLVTFAFNNPSSVYPSNILQVSAAATSAAAATAQYFEFSLSATNPSKPISLRHISFFVGKGGSSGPRGYRMEYRLDGGAWVVRESGTTIAAIRPSYATKAYTNINTATADTIDVRIFPFGPTSTSSLDFEDLTIITEF